MPLGPTADFVLIGGNGQKASSGVVGRQRKIEDVKVAV